MQNPRRLIPVPRIANGGRNTMKSVKVWVLAILLWESLAFPSWGATLIRQARIGIHPTHTRFVLDCEGDRPTEVSRRTEREWVIVFDRLENSQSRNILPQKPRGAVQTVQWESLDQKSAVKVLLKKPFEQAKIFTLEDPARTPNSYRLVIDFGLPGVSSLKFSAGSQLSSSESEPGKSREATPVSGLHGKPLSSSVPATGGDSEASSQESETIQTSAPAATTSEILGKNGASGSKIVRPIQVQSPYELAEILDAELKGALPDAAEQIIAAYQKAVQKEPKDPRRPKALLRMATLCESTGDVKKAERFYQKLIDEHPGDETTSMAWIRLGEIHAERNRLMEALKAFQEAEKFTLKPPEAIRLHWGIAQIYAQSGKPSEALDTLRRLLQTYPQAYLHKPEIFRTMGEAAFALKDFAASRDFLMRYLNLAPSVSDKDIVLARIAECYLHEGNRSQADKLYAYIQAHYPDSEGDLIGRLRKAEYYETQGPELREEAFHIYTDLASRPLAGPLKHFVEFKLAYSEYAAGRYEKSLERIDAVLKANERDPVYDDMRQLRRTVLQALVKKRFEVGDAKGVIDLYAEDPFAFQEENGREALACVAQAYEALGIDPEALRLYETLAQKDPNERWKLAVARMAYEMGQVDKARSLCLNLTEASLLDAKEELLARIAFSQKDYPSVIRYAEPLVKRRGGAERCPIDVAAMLALSLLETGKEDAAMGWAEQILRRSDEGDAALVVALCLKASRYRHKKRLANEALQLLDLGIAKVQSEDLRNQLVYQKALLLLEVGQRDQAEKVLSELLRSSKELWKTAAKQKLDDLKLQPLDLPAREKDAGAS